MTASRLPRTVGVCIATFLGVGKFPVAPGTAGSLAALPVIWLAHAHAGRLGVLAFAVLALVIGTWASNIYVDATGAKDPGAVVIDEVAGQAVAISFLPAGLVEYALAFIFFRLFDITKLWPANWVEKKLSGGLGMMLDDIVAGLYAGIASYLLILVLK